ncbi:MAG: ferredoxin reductase [Pseudomonadota bacterium]
MKTTPATLGNAALTRFVAKLTTPFIPDDFIRLVNPLWTAETLYARVEAITAETADSATITLQPGVRWAGHRAGQYVRIGVAIDGVRHTRCYSLSSAPERADGRISITVKAVDGGRVSNFLVRELTVGTVIDIAAADGDFTMPYALNESALLIAAGSGITPVMSLLRSAAARDAMPTATLLYYTPSPADTIFRDELIALAKTHPALTVQFIHTRVASDSGLSGHFAAAHLKTACADWKARRVWACGPGAMLDAIETQWSVQGLQHQLTIERFRPALRVAANDTTIGTLDFTASQQQATREGSESILETAERAGLMPAHGCRMGICHGCTAKLICGEVRDLRDGRVYADEGDLIQICVCAPVGAVQIDL